MSEITFYSNSGGTTKVGHREYMVSDESICSICQLQTLTCSVFQPGFRGTERFCGRQAGVPPVANENKAEIDNKVTRITSNINYSGHTSLFLIWATINYSVTHINQYQ